MSGFDSPDPGNCINQMHAVPLDRKNAMVQRLHNQKIQLVFILMTCCLLAGTVNGAVDFNQLFSGVTGNICDSCSAENQSVYGTCGDRVTMISQDMTGARFTGTPTSGPAPLHVQFLANTGEEIATWSWDFGDGSFGSGMNPVHIYTTPGTYAVKLTVRKEQTKVNYQSLSSFSWGEENTWQKEAMIQVTGVVGNEAVLLSYQKGTPAQIAGLIRTENIGQSDINVHYQSGMFQPLTLIKNQPPDFTRAKISQSVWGHAWKTGMV